MGAVAVVTSMQDYLTHALARGNRDKAGVIQSQWMEAVEAGTVHCPCGRLRDLTLTFRCLYCGVWYCTPCAEAHFGRTVEAHRWGKPEEKSMGPWDGGVVPGTLLDALRETAAGERQ